MSAAVVLITGGATGIGRAVAARAVARQARVVLWDISGKALAEACEVLGPLSTGHEVDISDTRAVADAEATLSGMRPTHLVNNAGILGHRMGWDGIDSDSVSRVLSVNVVGAMNVTSAFLRQRTDHPGAAIVNMASIAGQNGGAPGFAAYGASKGALIALTRAMARDLAPDIRVNALAPGIIATAMQTGILADREAEAAAVAGIPLERMGMPEDVAAAADWLLFDAPYVTGEVIRVAGGRR